MKKIGIDFDSVINDQPVNVFFDENGFGSKQFLKNVGSGFVYIFLYIASWVIFLIINRLASFWGILKSTKERFENILMWNQTFSLIFS